MRKSQHRLGCANISARHDACADANIKGIQGGSVVDHQT